MRSNQGPMVRAVVAVLAAAMALASGMARANDSAIDDDARSDESVAPVPAQGCPMSRTCRYEGSERGGYEAGSCEPGGWNCIGDPCHCEVYLNNWGGFGQIEGTFQP